MRHKAERWLAETTANEVVLISLSEDRRDLWAEIHRRAGAASNPVQHIDFGEDNGVDLCAAPGQCVLQLSLVSIFGSIAAIPPPLRVAPYLFPIDLFYLRQDLLLAD